MERVLKQGGKSTKKHGKSTQTIRKEYSKNIKSVLKQERKSTQTTWKEYLNNIESVLKLLKKTWKEY